MLSKFLLLLCTKLLQLHSLQIWTKVFRKTSLYLNWQARVTLKVSNPIARIKVNTNGALDFPPNIHACICICLVGAKKHKANPLCLAISPLYRVRVILVTDMFTQLSVLRLRCRQAHPGQARSPSLITRVTKFTQHLDTTINLADKKLCLFCVSGHVK